MSEKHPKLFILYMLVCCSLLLISVGCKKTTDDKKQIEKNEIDKEYQRGPLTVHVRVDKAKVTIADTISLELETSIEQGYEVKMPQLDKVLEKFGIVDWDNLGNKLGENNHIINTYRYKLEPFLSGTDTLPAFTFEFRDTNNPKDDKHELATEPIDIEVASLLGEQRAELKIADIEGVVTIPTKPFYGWIWALPAAGIAALVILWLYRRGRRTEELIRIFKPAHEIAYDRLQALVKQDLVTAGKLKEFYECISDILRHYIEHRFNLKAPERTTEEFLLELTFTNSLAGPDQKRLGEFLQHCDLVKFAKYSPTTEQIQKAFDLVKNFIETTKSDENKIDVTEVQSEEVIEGAIA
jgi:hypothetical protein